MPSMNIFANDAFSLVNMTKSVVKLPYKPSLLDRLGLFKPTPIMTEWATVEEKQGKLALVQTSARNQLGNTVMSGPARQIRAFKVPFLAENRQVMAADVQNLRAFGSENEFETVSSLVNDKMESAKQDIEVTKEWHRIGAINGVLLDADGSTVLYNYFNEFGVSPTNVATDFSVVNGKTLTLQLQRTTDILLGGTPYSNLAVICGNSWFDSFVSLPDVEKAWQIQQFGNPASFFMEQQANVGGGNQYPPVQAFRYGGVDFYNYRGQIGSQKFVVDNTAISLPIGADDIFTEFQAPAPFLETANTMGQPFYAKMVPDKWGTSIEINVNASPLMMCTRPAALIVSTGSSLNTSGLSLV